MYVPFSQAKLTIVCEKHYADIQFWSNDNAQHLLDLLQLVCPGLGDEIGSIRERMQGLDTEARLILGRQYLRDNPAEAKDMPGDWIPTNRWTYDQFPQEIKDKLIVLDTKEETLAEECRNSWVVRLTSTKDSQEGAPSKD